MEKVNSVYLEGFLQSCRLSALPDGGADARLMLYTVHPDGGFPGESPSGHSARVPHLAVGKVPADVALRLRPLAGKDLASEGKLVCCSVLGRLSSDGADACVVRFPEGGFRFTDSLRLSDNNMCKVTCHVESASFTDRTAFLSVNLGDGDGRARVHVSKDTSPALWKQISEGRFSRGDALFINSPLSGAFMSNGQRSILLPFLVPSRVSSVKLDKDRRSGKRR